MSRWIGGDGDLRRSVALVDTGPAIGWVSGQSTYTSSGRSFGAAHPRRIIVAAITLQSLSNGSELLSGSIGGVPATVATQDGYHYTAIMYARVPTGTSGNIVMTIGHDGQFLEFSKIFVYRVIAKDLTPVAAYSYNDQAATIFTPLVGYIAPPKFSVAVAVGQNNNSLSAVWGTWFSGVTDPSGMIEDADLAVNNNGAVSCAHRGPESSAGNQWKVSYTAAGGSTPRRAASVAVWC